MFDHSRTTHVQYMVINKYFIIEYKRLNSAFRNISCSLLRHLQDANVEPKKMRADIAIFPEILIKEAYTTVDKAAPDLQTKDTLTGLFSFLNACVWNFMDYHLMEHVLETYGSEELKSLMAEYVCDLKAFMSCMTVSQLMECWPGQVKVPEGFDEASAKIDIDPDRVTIAEMNLFREKLCGEFLPRLSKYTKYVMHHSKVKRGCFGITWIFPSSLTLELEKAAHKHAFFEKNLITSFSVQNKEVYKQIPAGS